MLTMNPGNLPNVIFDPIELPRGLRLKNRLVVAPMTTYSSHEDGTIAQEELDYLRRRAEGGFGMVMTAACYVHESGHAFYGQWACSDDRFIPSLRAAADAIKAGGSTAVLQIHHGGRRCPPELCGGQPISASAVPAEIPANSPVPRAMTEAEILRTIDDFAQAARRAKEAGYDGVEIHGANTYLLQQFVSPHSNRREDVWGQDRLRFPLAVTDAVLVAVGDDFPVGYRFSPEEAETPGIRIGDTLKLVEELCSRPLSWLHISLRDYRASSLVGDFTEPTLSLIAKAINGRIPFMGVGQIKTGADAEAAIQMGSDLVALARVAISEPAWPDNVAANRPLRLTVPKPGAAEALTIPPGLEAKIYSVPGWFEVEEQAETESR